MKTIKFTDTQIVKALKEYDNSRKVEDVSREPGISNATFYKGKERLAV
jgi:putative transposase